MAADHARYVWMNGETIPWQDATLHIRTECVMRGANVFEGIRAYWNADHQQLYVFKPVEHIERLFNSMKMMRMSESFSHAEVLKACIDLLARNQTKEDVHLRPTAYFGEGGISAYLPSEISTGMFISTTPVPSKLDSSEGIDCCVSSWARISDDCVPPRVKAGANYQNSRLAAVQAKVDGYDDAILLNRQGKVAEGTVGCLFIVRGGVPTTSPVTAGILESITRRTLIELLATEMDISVVVREIDRTELYVADEAFFCGTGLEILPIRSVDRYPVGDGTIGALTNEFRRIYSHIVRGENVKYEDWLVPVYSP
jgi:branched-chain amino acid aminotransferase